MANCHNLFVNFEATITLSRSRKESLRNSREALRKKIRKYLKEEKPDQIQPKFHGQGSFSMNIVINPIPVEKDKLPYDLDDGIYFIGSVDERKDPSTYHSWIYNAVEEHANETKDKNTCIRVIYADGHHIDVPIYYIEKDNDNAIPELAHKSDGWVLSDPREFVNWYKARKNSQLNRLIKYSKAWLDKKNEKFCSGFLLTILVVEEYVEDDREDISFHKTMKAIQDRIETQGFICHRPSPDGKPNLFDKYSTTQRSNFLQALKKLVNDGTLALENKNQKRACEKWQRHFGNRFPCQNAKDELEDAKSFGAPAVVGSSAKSA